MVATRVRVPSAVALAAAIAVVTAWTLRHNAQFLPTGDVRPNLLTASAHGHAGGGNGSPAAILGEAPASYLGLGMFALHALMVAVVAVSYVWQRRPRVAVDPRGLTTQVLYAVSVSVVSAAVAAGMAGILLGGAISFAAALTSAFSVLRYSFVLTLVFSAVFGIP